MKFFSLILLFLLVSCSLGVTRTGGERSYIYDVFSDYQLEDLKQLAPEIVTTSHRDPSKGKLDDLFSKKQPPLKRVGILVFESIIQPTRGGLAKEDKIYLSAHGKQLLTEKLLSMWDQSFPLLANEVVYIPSRKIKKSKTLPQYGLQVTDHVKSQRHALAPDDIFYTPPGKEVSMVTTLNPRGMRDLSLALVPASELMQGPKFSEHMKHAVNDLSRELDLDAVLIVMSELSWSASRIDKHSGEIIPEEVKVGLKVTTLIPFTSYHQRLQTLGEKRDLPKQSIAYRTYEALLKIPVLISVPEADQRFEHIEQELLNPMLKAYNDLMQMTELQIINDLKKTH